MTALASQAPVSSYFLCVSNDAVQDLPVLLLHTGLMWKLAGTETENALGEQQISKVLVHARCPLASCVSSIRTLNLTLCLFNTVINNKKWRFLSGHFCGKLGLPEVFICIFFLSFGTKRPSTAFLGSVLYKYIWLPGNYALSELYQCFPARENHLVSSSNLLSGYWIREHFEVIY